MKITLEQAIELLQKGEVVAIPTETVYGLAASSALPSAVQKIFTLKGRPSHNPLILHVGCHEEIYPYLTSRPAGLESLIARFWPGPLTVVLPIKEERILPLVRANLSTAAFRMPNHSQTVELLSHISPLVAPSANLSGSPSSTKPEHVEQDFGLQFPILDGQACVHGVESTIIIYRDNIWQIARLGALSQEEIAAAIGYLPPLSEQISDSIVCPGQLLAHYAPKARLHLSAPCGASPYVVGFKGRDYPGAKRLFLLGENEQEAAHSLYNVLRQLDIEGVGEAWVDMDFPRHGLWKTIHERLSRAASR